MKKGRSQELIQKRDAKLLQRYYYWTEVKRLRFDDALKILSEEEFFISVDRIMAIVRSNCEKFTELSVKPVPVVKKPKLTKDHLSFLTK